MKYYSQFFFFSQWAKGCLKNPAISSTFCYIVVCPCYCYLGELANLIQAKPMAEQLCFWMMWRETSCRCNTSLQTNKIAVPVKHNWPVLSVHLRLELFWFTKASIIKPFFTRLIFFQPKTCTSAAHNSHRWHQGT